VGPAILEAYHQGLQAFEIMIDIDQIVLRVARAQIIGWNQVLCVRGVKGEPLI